MRWLLLVDVVWSLSRRGGSTKAPAPQPATRTSTLIDNRGFLRDVYPVIDYEDDEELSSLEEKLQDEKDEEPSTAPTTGLTRCYMRARQVPGDGSFLFHALSAGLWFAINGTHHPMERKLLKSQSAFLRATAVDVLENQRDPCLYMGDGEKLRASQLLELAAEQQNQTPEEYCAKVREPQAWGGGPEIVALANALRRPIHVYELVWGVAGTPQQQQQSEEQQTKVGPRWCLRCIAEFGSPRFDRRHAPLHILSCDSRFPNLIPDQMLDQGNHFLLLFECEPDATKKAALEAGFDDAFAEMLTGDAKKRRDRRVKDLHYHEHAQQLRKRRRRHSPWQAFVADLDLADKLLPTAPVPASRKHRPRSLGRALTFATKRILTPVVLAGAIYFGLGPVVATHLPRLRHLLGLVVGNVTSPPATNNDTSPPPAPPLSSSSSSPPEPPAATGNTTDIPPSETTPASEPTDETDDAIDANEDPPQASNSTPFYRLRRRSPFHHNSKDD